MFKKEIKIFFTAVMFYTRIPCPKWVDHSPDYLNKATRYFPLVGWIIGAFCFAAYYGAAQVFPTEVSVIISMIAGILVTGAFHEDGFADVCDGFGGGWTRQKILDIMKDSRVGAYGVIGLIFLFFLKFCLLMQIVQEIGAFKLPNNVYILLLFIASHALSRFSAISIVFTLRYAREDFDSKSKPVAINYSWKEITSSFIFGFAPIVFLSVFQYQILFILPVILLVHLYLLFYFNKWIQGYTGDCLGAAQQIGEVVFYLAAIGIWRFI